MFGKKEREANIQKDMKQGNENGGYDSKPAKKIATVIIAKCKHNGATFGIRTEKVENQWLSNWAFTINDTVASNEGYDKTKITGGISTTKEYPGCPHCGSSGFFQCYNCGKITCWNGEQQVPCKWCGTRSGVSNSEGGFNIDGTGY